jgi:RimJ/RimL family protein N-acetyltransferase
LREVRDEDLPLLFEQWADPVAVHMAAFPAPDHMDWDAFERHWSRLRADEAVLARVIVVDDDIAGTIGSWGDAGEREVRSWIGRSYWGKGIATNALKAFLAVDRSRPLYARVASGNVGSRRVLEKCGFGVMARGPARDRARLGWRRRPSAARRPAQPGGRRPARRRRARLHGGSDHLRTAPAEPAAGVFGYHGLFHALTIVAVACQYVAIAFFVIRAG